LSEELAKPDEVAAERVSSDIGDEQKDDGNSNSPEGDNKRRCEKATLRDTGTENLMFRPSELSLRLSPTTPFFRIRRDR